MKYQPVRCAAALLLAAFLAAPAWAKEKAPKDEFKITGFVGLNSQQPAARQVIKLVDPESGKVLDMTETGIFGRYKFEKVKAGLYLVVAGEVKREVLVKDKDKRVDIDLSSKDGSMSYVRAEDVQQLAAQVAGAAAGGSGAGPAPGPNDPALMQSMAGLYWGYEGSTETKMALCENGAFQFLSESSYSGSSRDSLGNQTMAWGAAGQSGDRGNWRVEGNAQQGTLTLVYANGKSSSTQFRRVDNSCWRFGAKTLCRTGPSNCR